MQVLVAILLTACFEQTFWHLGQSAPITLETCRPPDYPEHGYYDPVRPSYIPGDVITYSCNTDTFIGGNEKRICLDSGYWAGDTPVCDAPVAYTGYKQSSTASPEYENEARLASDGRRETCSKTLSETHGATWTGFLPHVAREVLRFMVFVPKGEVSYEVFIVRADGTELSCGRNTGTIVLNEWQFHNCLPPNDSGAVAVKVRSLTNRPLELCEVVVHTLTDPSCADPHVEIDNGRVMLNRSTAVLVCDDGYVRHGSSAAQLDCIRTGVWTRRNFFCEERGYEVEPGWHRPSDKGRPARPGDPITSGNRRRQP